MLVGLLLGCGLSSLCCLSHLCSLGGMSSVSGVCGVGLLHGGCEELGLGLLEEELLLGREKSSELWKVLEE